jgi:hypothetical protein
MNRGFTLGVIALLLSLPAAAKESPNLTRVSPRGGQRGTEIDLTLTGGQLKDAQQLLLLQAGPRGAQARGRRRQDREGPPQGRRRRAARRAHDAAAHRDGISDLKTFYVGPFPMVEEKEPNNNFKAAPEDREEHHRDRA